RLMLANVLIGREWVLARDIVQQHALLGTQDVAKYGLGQICRGDVRLSQMDFHLAAAGRGCSFDPKLIALWKDQQTSFGAGMLDGRTHEGVDQLLQDDLARERFGHLHDGGQVEMLDGCLYRGAGFRDRHVRPEVRMRLLELSSLSFGAPTQVAVPRLLQVGSRNLLEAARRVKASGAFVGDGLNVDEALGVRRTCSLLVQVLSFEHATFDPGDFRSNDRGAALKGHRVMPG